MPAPAAAMYAANAEAGSRVGGQGAPITVRGLTKAFGEKTVLNGLDLQVPPGQFLAVVGRSGCGKSTLLRLLAGLGEPDQGRIVFFGGPFDEARTTVRVLFQEPRLLPWASVLANVEVGQGGISMTRQIANARPRLCARWDSRTGPTIGRRNCRAARSSGWRSLVRLSAILRRLRLTNRLALWTP